MASSLLASLTRPTRFHIALLGTITLAADNYLPFPTISPSNTNHFL